MGLCAARYSHRGTPLAHTIARTGWYSLHTRARVHTRTRTYTAIHIYSGYIAYVCAAWRTCTCILPLSRSVALCGATLYRGWENGWRRHICGSVGSEGNHEWRERQPVDKRENEARGKARRRRGHGSRGGGAKGSLRGHPCQPGDGHFAKNFRFVCTRRSEPGGTTNTDAYARHAAPLFPRLALSLSILVLYCAAYPSATDNFSVPAGPGRFSAPRLRKNPTS